MNVNYKDPNALIRIGYWNFTDKYSKINGPLLEYYQDDRIDLYFQITDRGHPKVDSLDKPFSVDGFEIEVEIFDLWQDNDPQYDAVLTYTIDNGIKLINADSGYFSLIIPSDDTMKLEYGHHALYLYFIENGRHRTVIKDFIEIVH